MKERPIIFNSEMVRAILDGRKTQTRRVMKNQPCGDYPDTPVTARVVGDGFQWVGKLGESCVFPCPFGQLGDRLWVRETFRLFDKYQECGCSDFPCNCPSHGAPIYRASHNDCEDKWTPSIHMPRHACRLVLEITGVSVERLRSMSQQDARAEGVIAASGPMEAGLAFRQLWESIYGAESWQANPWVWVIEFKRVEAR